jgi:hypothetical protein
MRIDELLVEVRSLIRDLPSGEDFRRGKLEVVAWRGAAVAVLRKWNAIRSSAFDTHIKMAHSTVYGDSNLWDATAILHKAEYDLNLREGASRAAAVPAGKPYDYFNATRKVIELAGSDLFIVDPWMDAEFAERFLVHVTAGATVRLLTSDRYRAKLKSAVEELVLQQPAPTAIHIREDGHLHGRYMFVDGGSAFISDASFKDGGKWADAILIDLLDVAQDVRAIFEMRWAAGTPIR